MKSHSSHVLFLLLIISVFSTSCRKDWNCLEGEGPVHSVSRPLYNFTGLDLEIDCHVNLVQDSIYGVIVTTYDNYHRHIHMNNRNGVLVISSDKSLRDDYITIEIHVPQLYSINVSGSGKIFTTSQFYLSQLNLKVSGSGDMDFSGDVSSLSAVVSGSGTISLSGSAVNANMKISGSGKIKGYAMQNRNSDIKISGSGRVETNVLENMHVNISGSGSVYYLGNPYVTTDISGSGDIIHTY